MELYDSPQLLIAVFEHLFTRGALAFSFILPESVVTRSTSPPASSTRINRRSAKLCLGAPCAASGVRPIPAGHGGGLPSVQLDPAELDRGISAFKLHGLHPNPRSGNG